MGVVVVDVLSAFCRRLFCSSRSCLNASRFVSGLRNFAAVGAFCDASFIQMTGPS